MGGGCVNNDDQRGSQASTASSEKPMLPCHPCPHRSVCCSWSVDLADDEMAAIVARFGADAVVWNEEQQDYRPRVVNDRCIFLRGDGCIIHGEPYYPRVCRSFPWANGDGSEPYSWRIDICPELVVRADWAPFLDEKKEYMRGARGSDGP